jgi:Fic family protein
MNVDRLRELIRELIRTELEEGSTTGTGSTFNAGSGEAFATPNAFLKPSDWEKKKKKIKYVESK